MIRIGVVGAGKMGISHLSILGAHPSVEVAGVCDSMGYLLDVLEKYTGVAKYTDAQRMLDTADLDGVLIATPSASHVDLEPGAGHCGGCGNVAHADPDTQ